MIAALTRGRALVLEIGRFGIIGVSATLVHYFVALAAISAFPSLLSNTVGFLAAMIVSYLGHSRWTFAGATSSRGSQLLKFVAATGGGFGMSQASLWIVELSHALPVALALVVAVGVVPPTTYLLNKFWVFR